MRTSGVKVSDPDIDEHFKRSLGLKDYAAVFSASNVKETGLSGQFLFIFFFIFLFDAILFILPEFFGCTVDDHFAKALSETWTKLQATSRSKNST